MRKDFYDALETRPPGDREGELLERLPNLVALALSTTGWARQLAGVDPNSVTSREALALLPVLSAADLTSSKVSDPPFGGFALMPRSKLRRVLMSAGTYHPQARGRDWGGAARALFAAGIRVQDVVLNCLSYHVAPESFIMELGAYALGCTVIAAGDSDVIQARGVMAALKPTAYVGTADFLKRLLDIGGDRAMTLKRALVLSALTPALRSAFSSSGIAAQECYLHPDIGVIAYESDACEGLIVNEGLLVEIVRPGSGEPVDEGEVGEIVVTAFNPDYPMIRLATGDRSALLRGRSPCARTNMRLKGVLGQA